MALINKLIAIANGIRTLDDTTSKYTLDEMAGSVDEANAEIDTQAAKIAQLSTILDGKAGGGGSGAPQTIEITLKRNFAESTDPAYVVYVSVVNGNKILTDYDWGEGEYTFTCCVGDAIYIRDTNSDLDAPAVSNNLSICDIRDEGGLNWLSEYWIIPNSGTTGTITM